LRHTNQPAPQAMAKIWKADGDTEEPSSWFTWMYNGQRQQGWAGFLAAGIDSQFEVDWFLLKADGLPRVNVTFPQEFGVPLAIQSVNGKLQVTWPAYGRDYLLEFVENLGESWLPVGGVPEETDRGFLFSVPEGSNGNQGYFRLVR
jgi:hypothetical protein